MRTFDRSDLWFGVVLAPIFALVALAALIVLGDVVTGPSFWSFLVPYLGLCIFVSLVRGPLGKLGRAPRFAAWFCIGIAATALFASSKGETFHLGVAAGIGLALAIIDLLVEHFRSKREAENG